MHQFETLPSAERLTLILESLFRTITRPAMPGFRVIPIAAPLFALIRARLRRLRNRFLRALATPYIPRRRGLVIARSVATKQSRRSPQPASPYTVPRHLGWLLHLIQETGAAGTQLAHCLNQPDAMALITADPRLGRLLRPLCFALHVLPSEVPCLYPRPARNPAPDPAPEPAPEPARDATPAAPPTHSDALPRPAAPQAAPIAEPPAAHLPRPTPPPRPLGTAPSLFA